ncbi:hypothetical protein BKA93DRAFT_710510, partial [Sparassis latifolia]
EVLVVLLTHPDFEDHPLLENVLQNSTQFLSALLFHDRTAVSTRQWAHNAIKHYYFTEVQHLTAKKHSLHFSAFHTNSEQIQDFCIQDMAMDMQRLAPSLWDFVGFLLS